MWLRIEEAGTEHRPALICCIYNLHSGWLCSHFEALNPAKHVAIDNTNGNYLEGFFHHFISTGAAGVDKLNDNINHDS